MMSVVELSKNVVPAVVEKTVKEQRLLEAWDEEYLSDFPSQ